MGNGSAGEHVESEEPIKTEGPAETQVTIENVKPGENHAIERLVEDKEVDGGPELDKLSEKFMMNEATVKEVVAIMKELVPGWESIHLDIMSAL